MADARTTRTAKKRDAFIEALTARGNVSEACKASGLAGRAITGTLTPTTGAATLTYVPSAADVAEDGDYRAQFIITAGGLPEVTFEERWVIQPKRSAS